jgi:hypothetical protein
MTRRHRLVPAVVAALATVAVIAPTAQARPTAFASGTSAVTVDRTVHDEPLANPVAVPASGLNHGAGIADRTRPIRIESASGTNWNDVFSGAAAAALVIAVCATGLGMSRRPNPAT